LATPSLLRRYIFLYVSLLSSVVAFPLSGYTIGPRYAYYLLGLYLTFVVVSVLAETDVLPASLFWC
jgi:hypothetical protein